MYYNCLYSILVHCSPYIYIYLITSRGLVLLYKSEKHQAEVEDLVFIQYYTFLHIKPRSFIKNSDKLASYLSLLSGNYEQIYIGQTYACCFGFYLFCIIYGFFHLLNS